MDEKKLETKLTPAAKEVLNEFTSNYKELLLSEAFKSALDYTGEVREISVRDILNALQKIESLRSNRKNVFDKLLLLYALLGLILVLISFVIREISSNQSEINTISIWIGLLFAFISIFLFYFRTFKLNANNTVGISNKEKRMDNTDYSLLIIGKWREIELLSQRIVSNFIGDSEIDNIPIGVLSRYLLKFNVLNSTDIETLSELLEKRNSLVHSKGFGISEKELKDLNEKADYLLKKLQVLAK